ncbi:MAG: hypothetical protein K2J77_01870 [Oscillospiraceae bacterium]|nr:hypothetical protein [Oscillospiraceae bacterium]
MKRIIALLVAVIIPITLLFTACGKASPAPLTEAEYSERFKASCKAFVKASTAWAMCAPETAPYTDAQKEECRKTITDRENALDEIKQLVPPKSRKSFHKDILKSLDYEYEWNKAALRLIDAKDNAEADEIGRELSRIVNSIPEGKSLPGLYLDFVSSEKKSG